MMRNRSHWPCILFFAATLAACPGAAQTPLGTSFTYQGELKQNGVRANGDFDFEFNLLDDADPFSGMLIATCSALADLRQVGHEPSARPTPCRHTIARESQRPGSRPGQRPLSPTSLSAESAAPPAVAAVDRRRRPKPVESCPPETVWRLPSRQSEAPPTLPDTGPDAAGIPPTAGPARPGPCRGTAVAATSSAASWSAPQTDSGS